jgi:hypothetical protein
MPAVVKKKECMPNVATYQGKKRALSEFVPQLAKVAIEAAEPRTRVGKISGVTTQITAQIESAIEAM